MEVAGEKRFTILMRDVTERSKLKNSTELMREAVRWVETHR